MRADDWKSLEEHDKKILKQFADELLKRIKNEDISCSEEQNYFDCVVQEKFTELLKERGVE